MGEVTSHGGGKSPSAPAPGGWIAPREIPEIDGPAWLASPDGEPLGEIRSHLQFLDVRLRIKRASAERHKVRYRGRDIPVAPDGKLGKWPEGLFDKAALMLRELI